MKLARQLIVSVIAVAMFVIGSSRAEAGQPIHESLVECAIMIDLLTGEQTPVPGQSEILDLYNRVSFLMKEEAVNRTSKAYVARMSKTKRRVWHERWDQKGWDNPANRGELGDWITYCMKLGEHVNLPVE